jgi:GNAT superfamily N-acetyltransferase
MVNGLSSTDHILAARIEAAESENIMRLAQALAVTQPEIAVQPFAGGVAVFAGVGSPMTHAVGIGMRVPVPEFELERMEGFFRDRNSPCLIDLCPLADPSVIAFVQNRRYHLIECNNVLARRIRPDEVIQIEPGIRAMQAGEVEEVSRLILRGFSEAAPFSEEVVPTMSATLSAGRAWIAGQPEPEAAAAMGVAGGVALFYGDATLPPARGKGWQSKLIATRLQAALREGCDLAMVSVLPGSGSHRNFERAGFQLIYMRVNLMREF